MKKIVFIIPPAVQLLDLAGPVQVFTEAKSYGMEISLHFYSFSPEPVCTAGIAFGRIDDYSKAELSEGDILFIPGMDFDYIESQALRNNKAFFAWLKELSARKVLLVSVCNAAFLLGEAGLLDHITCTTHWKRVKRLQERFPLTRVLDDVLFVKSGTIYSSAGISSGIDIALSILEELQGPLFTHKIAKELVVYQRRNSEHTQLSVYLDYRNHVNPRIHLVQDFLINNLSKEISLTTLAELAAMSSRNLTRVFKANIGMSIWDYLNKLKAEKAKTLRNDPLNSTLSIARECGFKSTRQLQRTLIKFG